MLLTITCRAENATDLGFLLHKNPTNVFEEKTSFGRLVVFYPEAGASVCTAALLLDVDPIKLVRGNRGGAPSLRQYVNDRPYVASSLLSVAIVAAFGTAMNGRSKERPERVEEPMDLEASLSAVDCKEGDALITSLFEPLGYTVETRRQPVDLRLSETGYSSIYTVLLRGRQTVQQLLTHLYVLIPVLDNGKHYFVGQDEVTKLLDKGKSWLPSHPAHELITRRYLNHVTPMVREALTQLREVREETPVTQEETDAESEAQETIAEAPIRLNDARMEAALASVMEMAPPAKRVLDLGCGEGRLLRKLMEERSLQEIVGVDVAASTLRRAEQRLKLDRLPERQRDRIRLLLGSLVYRDERFRGFDVALLIEVIEHLDPPRLAALEQVVFRHARPRRVVLTTPNREYNVTWPTLPAGNFRHRDHRFEWTRAEFETWASRVAAENGYALQIKGVGPSSETLGSPTQMALFDLSEV